MSAMLMITLSAEKMALKSRLIRQLCQWTINGTACLLFIAHSAGPDCKATTTRLCANFASVRDATDFIEEFKHKSSQKEASGIFEIMRTEYVPEIEALSVMM